MDGAELVKTAPESEPQGCLGERQAMFLADVNRLPSVIATLFALPKMPDYNCRILLDRDARIAPRYQAGEGEVLRLQLEDGKLVEQKVFREAGALTNALEAVEP